MLQQLLPFTVLKRSHDVVHYIVHGISLQQLLPFTVLKPSKIEAHFHGNFHGVATALTVYGIETF